MLVFSNKKTITVLACGNAACYVIPPLVVFAQKTFAELAKGEVPSTMYGLSDNGWLTADIFEHWFSHHFLVHVPPAKLLLPVIQHNTIFLLSHENVIIFCLPPNTTHITQPLDKGAFGPLKMHQECQNYMSRNSGKVATQYEFMQVFSRAWYHAMTPQNLIGAFKSTGVFPLSHNVVEFFKATPIKSFNPEALSKKTGLAFIPLYSSDCSCSSHSSDQMSSDDNFTVEELF